MEQKQTLAIEEITHFFLLQKTEQNLKESSLSQYNFLCERYIVPFFKNLAPNELTNDTIKKFMEHLKNEGLKGQPLAPKTINDITSLAIQVIKSYCNFEINIKKPSYSQSEITVFTETECQKLKTFISTRTTSKKLGIMIAMLTGIRIGELCALKWEDIDLQNGVMHITKTMQRVRKKATDTKTKAKTKIIIDTPKSISSIRTIPLPIILINKLKKFKGKPDTYVLTNTKKYIEPRTYQRNFKAFLNACGVKDNNFHTLRHTFATLAVALEMDIKTLSVLLGHSNVSFTMKIYVHPNLEHKRNQMEKVAVGF